MPTTAYVYIHFIHRIRDLLIIQLLHFVIIDLLWQVPPRQPTGYPTLLGHFASSELIHPLYVLPVKSDGGSLISVYQPLSSPPPCDIHVVNLRTMQPGSVVARAPTVTGSALMALIIHRTAIDCSFPLQQSAASCPAAGGQVTLL